MLFAVLAAVLTTTPPPIPPESVPPPPEYAPPPQPAPAPPVSAPQPRRAFEVKKKPVDPPLKDSRFGLLFHPVNVFALALWVEGDLHVASGFSVFANVGGGFLGQFGWDAGVRYYIGGKHLDGLFIDLRNSGFGLPQYGMWMTGPGLQFGYAIRTPIFSFSLSAGFTTWFNINIGSSGTQFLGVPPVEAPVVFFPGISRPGPELPAVAPTLRFAFGPWF